MRKQIDPRKSNEVGDQLVYIILSPDLSSSYYKMMMRNIKK